MKNRSNRLNATTDQMLIALHNEDGLTLDVVRAKIAPDKKSIYYEYTKLLLAGLVSNEGHTKPLVLHLTDRGKRLVEKMRILGGVHVARPRKSAATVPPKPDEWCRLRKSLSLIRRSLRNYRAYIWKWLSCWNALQSFRATP